MPDKPNNPLYFWQELKRRRVLGVITVYAAVAFVILQLVEILAPSLRLPDWTMNFILVVLIIGFIIAIILSWIYDITSKGIEKTKPVLEISEKVPEKPLRINAWKIATIISATVIIGLIIFKILSRREKLGEIVILDKSIAVLPFKSLSDDPEKQYLADGVMDAILLHLSKIEDLRVMDRTSVEQYRGADKTSATICQELDVTYLLEGSFQKFGDQARLIVQLIHSGLKDHIWAQEFDREWKDIFTVQSEVAQTIARELQAVITPEEKQLIEKIPTSNQTAWDFYQRGKEELWRFWLNNDEKALRRAENYYQKALGFDSTFAQVYIGLANVYWGKHVNYGDFSDYLNEEYLDTFLILANTALSHNNQLAEAYTARGNYFRMIGKPDQALEEFDKAIKFNPNDWMAYRGKGSVYADRDYVKMIDNMLKAVSLYHGPELPDLYRSLGGSFGNAGFIDLADHYIQEALNVDGDTLAYYHASYWTVFNREDFREALEIAKRSFEIDSGSYTFFLHAVSYMYLEGYEDALTYFRKTFKDITDINQLPPALIDAIAGVFWKNGLIEEANYYFNEQISILNRIKELGRDYTYYDYDFASIYAFLGDKKKSYEYLRLFSQRETINLFHIIVLKNEILFEGIKEEPEFQSIVREIEAKYKAEHQRVRQWLEENDML